MISFTKIPMAYFSGQESLIHPCDLERLYQLGGVPPKHLWGKSGSEDFRTAKLRVLDAERR